MVYAINHKYVNNFSHKDAQNEILHTGDTLTLNIKRGNGSGRGTPLPDYTDPVLGLTFPPEIPRPKPVPLPPYEPPPPVVKEPTPPESEEDEPEETVAAFNIKINPKGRIAEIEELPVTPPPSRSSSRARSRSRSCSKDRRRSASSKRESAAVKNGFVPVQNGIGKSQNSFHGVQNGFGGISGPEQTFTYSKEVITQYSTVLSASNQSEGNVSENVNESFVIHGGSTHKMEDVLSPEDIERDIFEEKMEEQKLTELLTGEAEILEQGIVGDLSQGLGAGMQHSLITFDKGSNTNIFTGQNNSSAGIMMATSHLEDHPCEEVLDIPESFTDVEILELQEYPSRNEVIEVYVTNKDLKVTEDKVDDNYEISLAQIKKPLGFQLTEEQKDKISERSDELNEANIVDRLKEKTNENQTLENDELENKSGFSKAQNKETSDVTSTVQNDKPIHFEISTEINKIEDLSANMTKPASNMKQSNQIAESGSSCVIL